MAANLQQAWQKLLGNLGEVLEAPNPAGRSQGTASLDSARTEMLAACDSLILQLTVAAQRMEPGAAGAAAAPGTKAEGVKQEAHAMAQPAPSHEALAAFRAKLLQQAGAASNGP
mmetsp:Transcript_37402/g.94378  ORF Transcript_37402/g.94378 Transcript_37402/m.94378 type:complete len:114 (-) Transcript_37402:312-653(-)